MVFWGQMNWNALRDYSPLAICLIFIFIMSLMKVNVGTTNTASFFEMVEKLIE